MTVVFDLLVEAAFGADPDSDLSAASWTTVTGVRYVHGVEVSAGRHGFGSRSDAVEITLRVDNREGRWTPGLNTGAYYPNVVRNLPIKISANLAGETPVELATAFVTEYRLGWPDDGSTNDSWVDIVAAGRLRRLQRSSSPQVSALRAAVLSSDPAAYWPLEDGPSAATAASAVAGVPAMTATGSPTFGTGDGGDGSGAILDLAASGTAGRLIGRVPLATDGTAGWRVEWVGVWPSGAATQDVTGIVYVALRHGNFTYVKVNYEHSTTQLEIEHQTIAGSTTTISSPTAVNPYDGLPHHYRLEVTYAFPTPTITLYQDGTAILSGTSIGAPGCINTVTINAGVESGDYMPSIGHLAVWTPYDAPFTVDTAAAATGYVDERATERMRRVCEAAGVQWQLAPGLTLLGSYTTAMGVQGTAQVYDVLVQCEDSDGGILHDGGPDGSLVYVPRYAHYNRPVALALDVADRHLDPGVMPVYDDRDITNEVTVTQDGGTSGTYTDTDSVDTEGRFPQSVTLSLSDDEDPEQHASWLVGIGTVEGMRYPRIPVSFHRTPALLASWLSHGGIGSRITVSGLPDPHPPADLDLLVTGWSARLDEQTWSMWLDCVPYDPYEVIVLDTSSATLVSSVDSDDTAWSTVVSEPPRWTMTDVPLALECGGETVTATAISDTAISYVNTGTATHADNASLAPSLPASVTTGDLLLVVAAIRNTAATVTTPSGYTRLLGAANLAVFAKIHSGSESAPTVAFSGGSAGDTTSAFMVGLRNTISDVDHVLLEWSDFLNNSAQNIAYPPLQAPKYTGSLVMAIGWKQDDWTSVAELGSWTERVDAPTTTGNDQGLVMDTQLQTTPAAIATGSFVVTGGATAVSRGMVLAFGAGVSALTVTRAIDGTATSHAAGDQVGVANPLHLAL